MLTRLREPQLLLWLLLAELVIWIALLYPTITFWHNSIAYLVFISVWAVIRTALADIRIWHNERRDEDELACQTKRLEKIVASLKRIEEQLPR